MNVRLLTLTDTIKCTPKRLGLVPLLLFMLLNLKSLAQNTAFNTVDELKTEANRLFEDDEYAKCYKLYSQLVSNYPKDAEFNYRLGVCMLYCEPDKKKCFPYLQLAMSKPEEAPKDATFFLAKAHHLNYQFDEALKFYNDYKKIGSANQVKRLQVDKEIKACVNGKRLLGSFADLEVLSKKQLNEVDYFRSYDLTSIGGRLLVKPEDFKTSADKKKKDKSIVFLPKGGERVYFSSYGDKVESGRDIYFAIKLPNGTFSKPEKVKGINTEFDEDYPFLHPNGKTLYFSSKGHNSMGGYDIFKSTYIPETNTWSQPVNLEFPINSPDDDYLFVTDESEKVAYFSTGRYSPPNKIDVLKVNTERVPLDVAVLKGTVVKENNTQSVNSKITVKNMDNGETLGPFIAENNGNYNMQLPNGGKFIFTVETPGIETQSDRVLMPLATSLKPFKQTISYENKILKIINYFDETPSDDSYVQYLKLIEEKAKLDVKGTVKTVSTPTLVSSEPPVSANTNTTASTKTVEPTVTNSTPTLVAVTNTVSTTTKTNAPVTNTAIAKTDTKKGIDNNALVDIAKKDAEEANREAIQLTNDANDASEIAKQTKIEADKLEEEAKQAEAKVDVLTDENEKKAARDRAVAIRQEADNKKVSATIISDFAKSLETDAVTKQKEVEINNQYVKALSEASSTTNNKQALDKLETLQKQLEAISTTKAESNEKYNAIKTAIEEKEKEVAKTQERVIETKGSVDEVVTTIKSKEEDLAKAKRKEKKAIEAEITNLKTELETKEKINANAIAENKKQTDELESLKTNLDLANKIKNEAIATPITSLPVSTNTTAAIASTTNTATTNTNSEKIITNSSLKEKYSSAITTSGDPDAVKAQTQQLTNYNAAIKDAIAVNKVELTKTKNPTEKSKITTEIKALEKQKQENDLVIARAKQATTNGQTIANNTTTNSTNTNPSTTNSGNTAPSTTTNTLAAVKINTTIPATALNEAIIKTDNTNDFNQSTARIQNQLNDADTKAIYNFTNYQTPEAKQAQTNNTTPLQQLEAKEQAVKQALSTLNEKLKTNASVSTNTTVSATELSKQAEDLSSQARSKRAEAKDKTGTEKETILVAAKQLEMQSNEKYLELAKETKRVKQNEIAVNNENIKGLIDAAKASVTDLQAINNLKTDIDLYSKQASELRIEADAQNSYGAKIGAMSNAEEKENEIIQKQQQALLVLTKSNPTYNLKKSESETTQANVILPKEEVATVNKLINELNQEKVNVLATVVQANNTELNTQAQTIAKQTKLLNANPALRAEFAGAKQQIKDANDLLTKANQSTNLSQKVSIIEEASKKQQDAIARLNDLSGNLKTASDVAANTEPSNTNSTNTNSTTVKEPSTTNSTNTTNTNSVAVKEPNNTNSTNTNSVAVKEPSNTNSTNTNSVAVKEPSNTNSTNTNSVAVKEPSTTNSTNTNSVAVKEPSNTNSANTNSVAVKEPSTNSTNTNSVAVKEPSTTNSTNTNGVTVKEPSNSNSTNNTTTNSTTASEPTANTATANISYTVDVNQLSNPDSSFNRISTYFEKNTITLLNPSANNMKEKALADLKTNNALLTELSKPTTNETTTTASITPSSTLSIPQLSAAVANLEKEADELSKQAIAKRLEANTKKGKEKETVLAEYKNLENSATAKQVEAAQLTLQLNDAEYNANSNAINDLMVKAKADNLAQVTRLEQSISEVEKLRKEANTLRQEAANLTNDAARLGAIDNAEEKEIELLQKQKIILDDLKQAYPTYVVKEPGFTNNGNVNSSTNEQVKKQAEVTAKQFEALTTLTNAYNLEFESNKSKLPKKLTPQQQSVKQKAEQLSTESKRLLIQSSKTNSNSDKTKLYTQASKSGYDAVTLLNSLLVRPENTNTSTNGTVANNSGNPNSSNEPSNTNSGNTPRNTNAGNTPRNTNAGNTPRNTNATNTTRTNDLATNTSTGTRTLKVEGLEVINGTAYSNSKPIPIDEKIPDGLVFRVQVGAFKQALPNNAFKGLTPVNGQTTGNGYTRYTVGNFSKYENAGGVKNDLRNLGYNDAFVVAYFNGKKITLSEAADILKAEGKTIQPSASQSAGITANTNIPKAETILQTTNVVSEQVVVTKELEQTKDLLYTVQIGVYSKQVTKAQLGNLKPIYTEQLPSGLYRYTAGIYNNTEKITTDKNRVATTLIKDAFTTAYLNGKRIAFAEARQKQQSDSSVKMEAENPIIFPENGTPVASSTPPTTSTSTTNTSAAPVNTPSVTPFSNGVTKAPEPTAENGVKVGEDGFSFKVQIGVYSKQVPNDVAGKFLNIKTWPIDNKQVSGLFIYNIGNFKEASFAKKLKEEAIAAGITDAFITVYKDGKKITGTEANSLINK